MSITAEISNIFLQNDKVQQELNVKIEKASLQAIQKHPFLRSLIRTVKTPQLTAEEVDGTIKIPLLKSGENVQRVRQGSKYEYNTVSQNEVNLPVITYSYSLIIQEMLMSKLKDAQKSLEEKMREFSPHISNHYDSFFEHVFSAIEDDLTTETPTPGGILNLPSFTDGAKTFMGIDGTQTGNEYWRAVEINNTMTAAQLMKLVTTDATKTILYEDAIMELADSVKNKGRMDFFALGSNIFRLLRRSATVRDSGAWRFQDGVIEFEGKIFVEAPKFKKNMVRGFDSRYIHFAENQDNLKLSEFREEKDYHKVHKANSYYSCACYSTRRETCGQITFTNISDVDDIVIPAP